MSNPKSSLLPKWATISLEEYRADRLARSIIPFIAPGETVLDCGCGSLLIGQRLADRSGVNVFGIDVLNFNRTLLALCLCRGEHLAFATQSVDVVLLIFVLHHTDDAEAILRESLRVARRRVIVTEDVYQNAVEHRLLRALDWLGNRSVSLEISLPYHFRPEAEWKKAFAISGVKLIVVEQTRPVPWRPSRHRLFVLDRAEPVGAIGEYGSETRLR
jgi:ubiquinone/menaquinone biosynthesis C-methylase UbiE